MPAPTLRWQACLVIAGLTSGAFPSAAVPSTAEPPVPERSPLSTHFVAPTRIVWQSAAGPHCTEALLRRGPGQALTKETRPPCVLAATAEAPAAVLLDFGREISGYVELMTPGVADPARLRRLRVRFGESVSEAMADLGGPRNAQNDHALRDQTVALPWMGKTMVGPGGFRFVRLDNADPALPVELSQVRAVLQIRDVPRLGSFRCDDERIDRIWEVGAETVHLNMQDYLWDGVKRDRLVWVGDLHPEVATVHAVFGFNEVVPRSLDLVRDTTPAGEWMHGIASSSMRWVLVHEELWMQQGDREYLAAQQPYMAALLRRLAGLVGPDGRERVDGWRFLDWPTEGNPQGVAAGLQALLVSTLESGARLMETVGDGETARLCADAATRARRVVPDANGSPTGTILLALAGMADPDAPERLVFATGRPRGVSPFSGYYLLQALARSGQIDTALGFVRDYWGGMLDLGATTFWEHFDLEWAADAARIDDLVPPGKKDVHGDFGEHCYVGFRHSLCHGWSAGPTAWLSRTVLGVVPLEPGYRRVRVAPQLGSLRWAGGDVPTPAGPIRVRHERRADGSVRSDVHAPPGVAIER